MLHPMREYSNAALEKYYLVGGKIVVFWHYLPFRMCPFWMFPSLTDVFGSGHFLTIWPIWRANVKLGIRRYFTLIHLRLRKQVLIDPWHQTPSWFDFEWWDYYLNRYLPFQFRIIQIFQSKFWFISYFLHSWWPSSSIPYGELLFLFGQLFQFLKLGGNLNILRFSMAQNYHFLHKSTCIIQTYPFNFKFIIINFYKYHSFFFFILEIWDHLSLYQFNMEICWLLV